MRRGIPAFLHERHLWRLELHETPEGVRMVLTFDAMHSDEWTQRAVMGWESELGKLAAVVDARLIGGQQ